MTEIYWATRLDGVITLLSIMESILFVVTGVSLVNMLATFTADAIISKEEKRNSVIIFIILALVTLAVALALVLTPSTEQYMSWNHLSVK